MIVRRRVAFLRLCALLRKVEADLDDFGSVRALNLGVLKEVLRDEGHIRRHRTMLKDLNRRLRTERPSKVEASVLRMQMKRHEHAIDRYTNQLFIWRCLADGLAYAYIGTFNIKHVFFDTTSPTPKPEPGFISGKSGLMKEVALLLSAIEHRVPAVLCDITNIIRYGDICLLGADDPVPIEVKSRQALNQRGKRQASKLATLESFLKGDYAAGFRGAPEVRRVAYSLPHRDCIADINACIQAARCDGWNAVCPERGLVYAAVFSGDPITDLFGNLEMARPMIFLLNADKQEKSWAPYLPFTNSIRDPQDLFDFVVGNLSLIVIVDAAVVCDRLVVPGWKVSLLDQSDRIVLLEEQKSHVKIAISIQFIGRLGYEFMSLDWFVEHERESVAHVWTELMAGQGTMVDVGEFGDLGKALEAIPRIYETGKG